MSPVQFSSSVVSNFLRPHGLQHARPPCPSPTPGGLLKLHWVGEAIQPSHSLLSPSPPTFNLSQHQSLSKWFSSLHQVAKYCSFNLSISASSEYSGLISFRFDWLDLLTVQGTLKSLLQYHSLKALILWHSAFFMVQLSHSYMTIGKIIGLTIWTFVGKVIALFFNMWSRFLIAFLPRSKWLLISWLQSPSSVIFGAQENKTHHCFHFFAFYLCLSQNYILICPASDYSDYTALGSTSIFPIGMEASLREGTGFFMTL